MRQRIFGLTAIIAGLFTSAQAQPAHVTAGAAPAAWIRYAALVERQFEAQLGGDSEPAARLRTYLAGMPVQNNIVAMGVWLNPDGVVTRIAFAPFLDSTANADLTALLQGTRLSGKPPTDMPLPIHLALHVASQPGAPVRNLGADGATPPHD